MNNKENIKENGQVIVIVALIMIALMAMLAIALDGGNVLSKRRAAQNAADAGALAGARALCLTSDADLKESAARAAGRQYALFPVNEADDAAVYANKVTGQVVVTTTIPVDTYFAHFVGFKQIDAKASAAAECCPSTIVSGVLPIAWVCQRPPLGEAEPGEENSCVENAIPWSDDVPPPGDGSPPNLEYYLDHPTQPDGTIWPELYIVMNSNSQPDDITGFCDSYVDPVTGESGWIPCDIDGDGDDDLVAHGDRSWLDLDGAGGGASELISWIQGEYLPTMEPHIWFGGEAGVENSVFQAVGDIVGTVVTVPVFNAFCDDHPVNGDNNCIEEAHATFPGDPPAGVTEQVIDTAGGNYYYHVVTYAHFYITCVDAAGVPGSCPGHDEAVDMGAIANNVRTIEGYFVTGIDPDAGERDCSPDAYGGIYSLGLIK